MADVSYSPSDPFFFMHHAFIDYMYALYSVCSKDYGTHGLNLLPVWNLAVTRVSNTMTLGRGYRYQHSIRAHQWVQEALPQHWHGHCVGWLCVVNRRWYEAIWWFSQRLLERKCCKSMLVLFALP